VPQDREGRFSTELFERHHRSEKVRVSALLEMYVQGVSSRKGKAISGERSAHEFSASAVSGRTNRGANRTIQSFARRRPDDP
jgi:transposase-like protein